MAAMIYSPLRRTSAVSPICKPQPAGTPFMCEDTASENPVCEFFDESKVTGAATPAVVAGVPLKGCDVIMKRNVSAYVGMGAPTGLADMLATEDAAVWKRIFVLDNSGSTCAADGHVLRKEQSKSGESLFSVQSTRWEEIMDAAIQQAQWNATAGVQCEFVLLNSPSAENPVRGRDFAVIDPSMGAIEHQVNALRTLLRVNGPRGPTPLTLRLQQLRQRLLKESADGKLIVLSIFTDGLPSPSGTTCTEGDKAAFMNELRTFASTFNSFIVIRLATDDDATVKYYNDIDGELELPLDILDDLKGEAAEVHASGNGWFAYSPLIHRIREGGTTEKIFDLLDERPLTVAEIATVLEFLLRAQDEPPFPRRAQELYEMMKERVPRAGLVFNGRLDRMTAPVDLKLLKSALGRTRYGRAKTMSENLVQRARNMVTLRSA